MPFKTKEQRNNYMKKYYLNNPKKYQEHKEQVKEYMKKKRLERGIKND